VDPWKRVRLGVGLLTLLVAVGTVGYVALGFSLLNAAYQTVTTISTVGFREVEPFDARAKLFTMLRV
jgi:voltage-gated potassium channel